MEDVQFGAHVDVGLFPFGRARVERTRYEAVGMRYLRLRAGIRYAEVPGEDTGSEWRGIGELTPRFFVPLDLLFTVRNRIELRWIDGAFSWRYRPRLRIQREMHLGTRLAVVPYLSAEACWDSRADAWARVEYRAGILFAPITRWLVLGLYWALQEDEFEPDDVETQAVGLVVPLYF